MLNSTYSTAVFEGLNIGIFISLSLFYILLLFFYFVKNLNMWQNIILVGLGSMIGGISRFLLSGWIKHCITTSFPWGTFVVNMIGCFLIGILSGIFATQDSQSQRLFFIVGFCGSFTTFSTFSMENLQLLTSRSYALFSLNTGISVITGILFAGLGYMLTTKLKIWILQ